MKEKFYCVGCKQHYELSVHAAQRQPSKGGSFRHSLISECPKGHRVNKLCKKELYETYNEADDVIINDAEEEGSAPVQDPMEFGEMANWTPLDGTPSLRKRKRAESQTSSDLDCGSCGVSGPEREGEPLCSRCFSCFECCESNCADYDAEGMTVGVNLEALEPTPDEPESGESMVPADSLMPEGSGHVIGSQSTSHNYTPFHADSDKVETFIVYPELYEYLMMQELLPSNKTSTKHLQDDDYEVTVPAYLLDEILAAVSEYQSKEIAEKSDSDFAFGKSKTTVAVAAAGVALMGAWLWNKRK